MNLSITDPKNIYKILDKELYQITRHTSLNEPQVGELIKLYYRKSPEFSCYNCLNSEEVRGVKCPYYDSKNASKNKTVSDALYSEHKRQSGSCKCIQHTNFIGNAVITAVEHYAGFHLIPNLLEWANAQGFKSPVEAKEHYDKTLGNGWEDSELTVISWKYIGR